MSDVIFQISYSFIHQSSKGQGHVKVKVSVHLFWYGGGPGGGGPRGAGGWRRKQFALKFRFPLKSTDLFHTYIFNIVL